MRGAGGCGIFAPEVGLKLGRRAGANLFWLSLAGLLAVGCEATPGASTDIRLGERAYCAAARLASLSDLYGDLVTLCAPEERSADGTDAHGCRLLRVREDGTTEELATGVRAAWPLGGARRLQWTEEDALEIVDGASVQRIADYAEQPTLRADAHAVAFVEPLLEDHRGQLGVPTQIVVVDLRNLSRVTVSDDEEASRPIFIPASEDLLVLSTRFEMASLVRVGPSHAPIRLTNLEHRTQDTVPPPSDQIAWHEGALVYSDSETLYTVDIATGTTRALGPGAWPRLAADGSILAAAPERCPVRYLGGEAP